MNDKQPFGDPGRPCESVSKMRTADHFEPWCPVHHHWLNGSPAVPVMDAEIARLKRLPVSADASQVKP